VTEDAPSVYRVAIRYYLEIQRYEIFELRADNLCEALRLAVDRFPDEIVGSADLVEVRRAKPAS
jgi:hypothetical protein